MHSALDCRFGTSYNHLTPEKLGTFRKIFEDLQLIIVDEMSMISADSLYDIDHRLRDIFIYKHLLFKYFEMPYTACFCVTMQIKFHRLLVLPNSESF